MKKKLDNNDEVYYKVLDIVNTLPQTKQITDEELTIFKGMIRDNKYVSTYIRALKLKMTDYNSINDFIRVMDKHDQSKSFEDVVDYEIRQILDSIWQVKNGIDPIQVINTIITHAIEREGKICDFRDSVNPEKKFGRCGYENHYELNEDSVELTEAEQKIFNKIKEKDGYENAYDKFIDKFNPIQELTLTLYPDEDTSKFDDGSTCYICKVCMEDCTENNDCEVSCDME